MLRDRRKRQIRRLQRDKTALQSATVLKPSTTTPGGLAQGVWGSASVNVKPHQIGSAAIVTPSGSAVIVTPAGSASAHGFDLGGGPFAGVVPPDVLDLDTWMNKGRWDLGRLKDHKPTPPTPQDSVRQLDEILANVPARAAGIHIVPKSSDTPRFDIKGGSVKVREDVWRVIVNTVTPGFYHHLDPRTVTLYKGVPVYELLF